MQPYPGRPDSRTLPCIPSILGEEQLRLYEGFPCGWALSIQVPREASQGETEVNSFFLCSSYLEMNVAREEGESAAEQP